ncbi:LysM peptidoglycan-binding domain-containing protein [Pseudomonas sp. JS3066]|jgi:membrane-bound lytic murein transglycosylase D|uniref:LysM peptidoglycan-binding domain-containing protein n=1 Tax=unclassified Pseudomonas TaxID=196821 RepID=UPI002E7B0F82|nr:LysM peptidoglycan-binding domain-containing protein [Pseudomonas sp. JS3066]WVK91228.1 LysM peptidoglycan-binding domain-containing protein [Pseudomonas sp. JS3066]
MLSSPIRNLDLDALARAARALVVVCAVTLAGCSGTGQKDDDQGRDTDRALAMQQQAQWLEEAQTEREPQDIWERMRNGFKLQDEIGVNPRIERQRLWYVSKPSFLESASDRGSLYIHYVVERLEERNMPLELALLPVVESAYNPFAYSRSNAVGIWQFIPSTGRHFNLRQTNWYDGRRDITASTNAALNYLERLHEMFNGDWLLALAAYNAGEGTVSRAIERNQKLGLPTDYWNLPLPQETQDYVPKLLALSQLVMAPEAYGVNLNPIANEPYFEVVEVKQQRLDLSRVAAMADMDADEMYQLNPAFKKRITMDGPQHLLVPTDKAELLTANLALMKPQMLVDWQQYRVRNGDSLHGIANRYHVTVKTLKEINGLSGNHLRVGQQLSIPVEPGLKPDKPLFQNIASAPAPTPARNHKVKRGDNLSTIARQYKVTVQDIKRWNHLKGNHLKAGQVLKLEGGATQVASASATSKGKSKSNGRESVTYYKVKQGDSLYLIAKRFNVEMKHLQRWNPRSDRALKPGQTLTVYLP